MKAHRISIFLIMVFIFLINSIVFAEGNRWVDLVNNDKIAISLDSSTITGRPIISCWIKTVFKSDKLKEDISRQIKINPNDLSYSLWNFKFDTRNNTVKKEVMIYKNSNGTEIYRETINGEWETIEPESLEELIFQTANKILNN